MVKSETYDLGLIFAALADPKRRKIVDALQQRPRTVGELARPFAVSLAAISKHLQVLVRAQLVVRERRGREIVCRLNGAALQDAQRWLNAYTVFWEAQLDSLDRHLKKSTPKGRK